jgi:hypothetical protein
VGFERARVSVPARANPSLDGTKSVICLERGVVEERGKGRGLVLFFLDVDDGRSAERGLASVLAR